MCGPHDGGRGFFVGFDRFRRSRAAAHLADARWLPAPGGLLPVSALLGAIFLLWADTIARTLFAPLEVPVGVITALVGVPIFATILARARKRWR